MKWFMLTVVGEDRPGIVAKITAALYEGGCHLGEASMMRLGSSFTIMVMVGHEGTAASLAHMIETVTESLGLHAHVDAIKGGLHQHVAPDVRITVAGADRPGIVAEVTGVLAEAGLNILDLESDVAGSEDKPLYIMHMEGSATEGVESLQAALELVRQKGIDVSLTSIDTVIG